MEEVRVRKLWEEPDILLHIASQLIRRIAFKRESRLTGMTLSWQLIKFGTFCVEYVALWNVLYWH